LTSIIRPSTPSLQMTQTNLSVKQIHSHNFTHFCHLYLYRQRVSSAITFALQITLKCSRSHFLLYAVLKVFKLK
jgi:hypothetical protein